MILTNDQYSSITPHISCDEVDELLEALAVDERVKKYYNEALTRFKSGFGDSADENDLFILNKILHPVQEQETK